jgi:hypothetical protein
MRNAFVEGVVIMTNALGEELYYIQCPTCGDWYGVTVEGNYCCCDGKTRLYAFSGCIVIEEEWDVPEVWWRRWFR